MRTGQDDVTRSHRVSGATAVGGRKPKGAKTTAKARATTARPASKEPGRRASKTEPVTPYSVLDAAMRSLRGDRGLDEWRHWAGQGLVKLGAIIKAVGETIEPGGEDAAAARDVGPTTASSQEARQASAAADDAATAPQSAGETHAPSVDDETLHPFEESSGHSGL
jgi:hypothetical protein